MNLIVRNEKPVPAPEPFEKRVARTITESDMNSWSDDQLMAAQDGPRSAEQEAAAYLLRTRTPHEFDVKLWIW